jgi:hypothetical protein
MAKSQRLAAVPDPIAFRDLREREQAERRTLENRFLQLKDLSPRKRSLTTEEKAELQELEQKLATDDVVDPLFKAVQKGLGKLSDQKVVGDHKDGLLPSQQASEVLRDFIKAGRKFSKLVDIAGFASFPSRDKLVQSLESLQEDDIPKLHNVAGLFDNYAASLGDTGRKKAALAADRNALGAEIQKALGKDGFGFELATAVTQDHVFEAESLVDWLLAAADSGGSESDGNHTHSVRPTPNQLTDPERLLAAVFGILELDRQQPPPYHLAVAKPGFDPDEGRRKQQFGKALSTGVGEYRTNQDLFDAVLPILVQLGGRSSTDQVTASEWVQVVRYLVNRDVQAETESQLGRRVDEALNNIQNVGENLPTSLIAIDLPDLEEEETTDHAIVADNISALQPAYFCAMFEELKAFQVVDKLLELFQNGILPIGRGEAGNSLFKYWKETATRVSEPERRSFYARTLGFVGGDDGGMPNREFNDLWMRFVSAVSSFVRQNNVDDLLRTKIPGAISQQQVRKSGRDLAMNLSLHGYGMAYFMATELQKHVKDVIKLLSDPDIKAAYGARDMWQVIDQVAALELGGSRNSVRYRTMATSGAIIMAWLSKHAQDLSSSLFGPVLNIDEIRSPSARKNGTKPTTDPSDFDLVNACEQWLAVTGTQDQQIEDFSQAKEAPNMPSKPIQIPAIAREALESVDVPALSLGGGAYNRH